MTQTLTQRKEAAERRLAELRRGRGVAVLEGREVDHAEIARLEAEVAAFAEAEAEQRRRIEAERPRLVAAAYQDKLIAYREADACRLAFIEEAERSARDFASAIAGAQRSAEHMRAAYSAMSNLRRPGDFDEGSITPLRQGRRLASYLRIVLHAALKARHFGSFSIAGTGADHPPSTSWRDAEATQGSALQFLEENAPRAPVEREAA